uniref:ceramide synthase 4-like n=1 Tax=Euleptes europaea TaxID=460621 RepID=UPI002541F78D|nr:ceramide synthase 4-like [Euleptes europaea]
MASPCPVQQALNYGTFYTRSHAQKAAQRQERDDFGAYSNGAATFFLQCSSCPFDCGGQVKQIILTQGQKLFFGPQEALQGRKQEKLGNAQLCPLPALPVCAHTLVPTRCPAQTPKPFPPTAHPEELYVPGSFPCPGYPPEALALPGHCPKRMTLFVTQWFLKHEFWLPPGFTWEDMKETDKICYPQPQHLLLGIPFAFLLIGLRLAFERIVALPLSRKMGLREKVCRKPAPNAVLEAFYSRHRKGPEESELSGLAKQCDLQPRQVERWFRSRLIQDRPSLTKKFCEACWRTAFYITSFTTGLAALHDKSWFWDFRESWTGYPQQPLLPSIFAYYMLQLSFYCSLVITLPFDVKRKDFKEQIVHHAATIFLVSFSYCTNFLRCGTLIMIIHDVSDCFLEPSKIFNYLKWRWICNTLFIVFTIIFLVTRLVIYPYKLLYHTYYYFIELYQPFFGYYVMMALLIVLQLLHIFWSYLIIQLVYKFLAAGSKEKDVRSDSEDSEKGEEDGTGEGSQEELKRVMLLKC